MSTKLKKNKQTEASSVTNLEAQIELFAMGIHSCSCKLDRPKYMRMRNRDDDSEIRHVSATAKLEDHGDFYFDGSVMYELLVRDKKSGLEPLKLECTYEAHFHGPKSIPRDEANRFLQKYFKIISWPYFRQFVSDMTARMSIAPLILPLFPEGKED
jgi:preprotein translocase subunit SecB